MTEKPRETQAELHVVELKEKVNNSSLMKHRLFTHHTLLVDPAQTHFRKIAIHALSVHFCSIATQTPYPGD